MISCETVDFYLQLINEHEDQWGMKSHKECIWNICVLQFHIYYKEMQCPYFICVSYVPLWLCPGIMRNWKEHDDRQQLLQVLRHLLQCTKCWDCHVTKLGKVLDSIVTRYKRTHEQDLFELLSDLAVTSNQPYLYRYHYFTACTCFHHHSQTDSWLFTVPTCTMGADVCFPRGKLARLWSWPSSTYNSEVWNTWSFSSMSPVCSHGMVLWCSFTFTFLIYLC
jgi:hypothetical protein